MRFNPHLCWPVAAIALWAVPHLALAKSAHKPTQQLVATLMKVVRAEEGKTLTKNQERANQKLFDRLDTLIDFDYMTSEPLRLHEKSFSQKELRSLKKQFRQATRLAAYPRAGAFLRKAELTYQKPEVGPKEAKAPVLAMLEEEDLEIELIFHWKKKGSRWKLFDMSFDGASLTKDYQNQFSRIIKKEGPQALLKKINAKLRELRGEPSKPS